MNPKLLTAESIVDTEPDEALRLCNDALNENFFDGQALFMAGYIMMKAERFGLAYNLYERCAQIKPDQAEIYNNMGMCCEYDHPDYAAECFAKALALDPSYTRAMINRGLMYLKSGQPEKCVKLCTEALRIDPQSIAAHDNRAQAYLMLREWRKGWEDYQYSLGGDHRTKRGYGVPDWDFTPGKRVVVYGEQGIGDEILFASCIPDLQKDCEVIIDCDKRLKNVFERSFGCKVYGTRFAKESPLVDEQTFDASCSIGDLPRVYRNKHAEFPGGAYLTPDPERCLQWRTLFDTYPGLKIGIAWTGGLKNTDKKLRSFELDTFAPLCDLGHTFISLEYLEPNPEELAKYGIKHFGRAVNKGVDYDDTLALINELDLVICVTTTAVHAAGALGKECWALVPEFPSFRFHLSGDMPWHKSVKLIRQAKNESWADVIGRVKTALIKRESAQPYPKCASFE